MRYAKKDLGKHQGYNIKEPSTFAEQQEERNLIKKNQELKKLNDKQTKKSKTRKVDINFTKSLDSLLDDLECIDDKRDIKKIVKKSETKIEKQKKKESANKFKNKKKQKKSWKTTTTFFLDFTASIS